MKQTILLIFSFITIVGVAQNWRYVDPRIGSVGVGRTFPGPCMPFGMVKPGPDCGVLPNAGWAPMPEPIIGFSQTHVSGTGGGQKYGNILIQPIIDKNADRAERRKNESISLGYYATTFENNIRTEITTSERCAHYRIHYPKNPQLFIDASHFLGKDSVPDLRERQQLVGAETEVVNNHEVRGFCRVRGGWNNGDAYTVYFTLQTDVPFTYNSDEATATLQFVDTLVNVKVGISYVSALQARKNIDSCGFDEQLSRLHEAWEQQLCKINIDGTEQQKRMFYTGLYHTMIMPIDKTGENPKWIDTPYYDDYYAIWDTYRTSSPLITLLDPQREAAIVNSLLNIYRREGYLPDARSGDSNGRTQGGSNAEVVIADAYVKGVDGIDYELALEAMLKDGEQDPGADHERHGRGGLDIYKQLGYIPYGIDRAGNRTVEYAFNDYCIAQVAKGLGYDDVADKYLRRSCNWRNLWRTDYEYDGMHGFIMPRDAQGHWLDDVTWGKGEELFRGVKHTIPYTPVTKVAPWYVPWWATFFYEATSEEYSLSIPHDVEGLIEACGGAEAFKQRLDLFFAKGYYNVQNEPSFLSPCLYHWIGRPDLSTARVHQIINDHYTDQPDGLPGNDDSGAMSSWLAFHMMGLYPNAGMDYYLLNVPLLKAYTINLSNGKQLHVSKKGRGNGYKKALFNGKELANARITHAQLMEGGELLFETTTTPPVPMRPNAAAKKALTSALATNMASTISFTLNRQFRTWPFAYQWQGDTLVVQCKQTLYMIPRQQVETSDVFCWLNPQVDGTVHHNAEGTFCFISRRAFNELQQNGQFDYEGITWRVVDETSESIHVRAKNSKMEMWISKVHDLPLVLEMRHCPLGIDWRMNK
ncbi:MAG: glycoside hydrolase family 92 protein [Bacteroidales bacterium]|jgi:predicted alpha-1,2-mannosidase|nr:glycoside hydrolase family 92 protein [Bacteroidales bacterium]